MEDEIVGYQGESGIVFCLACAPTGARLMPIESSLFDENESAICSDCGEIIW